MAGYIPKTYTSLKMVTQHSTDEARRYRVTSLIRGMSLCQTIVQSIIVTLLLTRDQSVPCCWPAAQVMLRNQSPQRQQLVGSTLREVDTCGTKRQQNVRRLQRWTTFPRRRWTHWESLGQLQEQIAPTVTRHDKNSSDSNWIQWMYPV